MIWQVSKHAARFVNSERSPNHVCSRLFVCICIINIVAYVGYWFYFVLVLKSNLSNFEMAVHRIHTSQWDRSHLHSVKAGSFIFLFYCYCDITDPVKTTSKPSPPMEEPTGVKGPHEGLKGSWKGLIGSERLLDSDAQHGAVENTDRGFDCARQLYLRLL